MPNKISIRPNADAVPYISTRRSFYMLQHPFHGHHLVAINAYLNNAFLKLDSIVELSGPKSSLTLTQI